MGSWTDKKTIDNAYSVKECIDELYALDTEHKSNTNNLIKNIHSQIAAMTLANDTRFKKFKVNIIKGTIVLVVLQVLTTAYILLN